MLSLSSANAGSSAARGSDALPDRGPDGVVCEARRDVREGGRRGVVGREAAEGLRECDGVAMAVLELGCCHNVSGCSDIGGCGLPIVSRRFCLLLAIASSRLHTKLQLRALAKDDLTLDIT
jgi:hypothetical protein